MNTEQIKQRLEYLRGQIEAEQISYGEIAELQGLAAHIEEGDIVLLMWAGVPEHAPSPLACPRCGGYAERPCDVCDECADDLGWPREVDE